MSECKIEARVVSQEKIASDVYSMWIDLKLASGISY